MKFKQINIGIKLGLSFGFIILLTLAIVFGAFFSLNEIEQKSNDYKLVIDAQKDILEANSSMESYLNGKDSLLYRNCSFFLDSAIQSLIVLKPRLNSKNLPLLDTLLSKLNLYKVLMQQNYNAITKQNEIFGNRRKMRIKFTEELKKNNISKESEVSYYFNQARLNAVYLLSSTDQTYYNETKENIGFALKEAKKMNNKALTKALEDYMISVNDNYSLALKIKDTKENQIILGSKILEASDRLINNIDLYQMEIRKSTKVFMFIFSVISIIVSIVISQLVVLNLTRSRKIIEDKNKILVKQSDSLAAINELLEERQLQIEEQSEELKTQRNQLSELNVSKDKIFSILAHDLRSPFNSILGFCDLLLDNIGKYPIDKIESHLGVIRDSAKNTYELLENLLEWSRSQQGMIVFEPKILKISEYVKEDITISQQQARQKNITVELNLEGKERNIEADLNMINCVIRNLISNAIKFSEKGSKIVIALKFDEETFGFVIKDQGVGMTEDKKNKLFSVVDNVSTRGTEGEKGTGLGLLLCSDFIRKHKGFIGLESTLNLGSTFYFKIPYVQEINKDKID